jgi:multidrug efflux system membrane fusion protein
MTRPASLTSLRCSSLLPFALLGLGALFLAGCSENRTQKTGPSPVPVQVAAAERRALPRSLNAIGTAQALRTVAVKSQVDGVIATVHFREGDELKAGDLLVTLDQRPFENSLRMARAELANAAAAAAQAANDADRYNSPGKQDVISKEQFDTLQTKAQTTKSELQAREAAVANAELQLGYTSIRAPINGRTGQLNLHEGALVKANDASSSLVTINQLAPIAVAFAVPERVLDEVRAALAGDCIGVHVTGRDNATVQADGVVDFIDNTVDPSTGMITLKARFANADHALWPGRFVNVELRLGADADRIVVPAPAVQAGQKGPQIFVIKPDRTVELRPVTVARTTGDFAVLSAGVAAGETVVTDGQLRLVPGAKVEIRTLEDSARPAPAAGK